MKLPIIETKDYLLAVSDDAGEIGSIRLEYMTSPQQFTRIYDSINGHTLLIVDKLFKGNTNFTKKITAHLPLNDAPILKGINLLPELKDELEVLAYSYIYDTDQPNIVIDKNHPSYDIHRAYKNGYKAATKKYTEEDLMRAMNEVRYDYETNRFDIRHNNEIVQSLNKPKYPKYFIPATNVIVIGHSGTHNIFGEEIISTTDAKGQTTLKGTYSYE